MAWTPTAGFASWQSANFSPAQLAYPLISGPAAEPDNDGLSNLLEWACALSPLAGSSMLTPTALNGGNNEFIYTRSIAALNSGAIFTVEWSDTIAGNNWSSSGVTQTVQSGNGTSQQVKAVLPEGGNGRRFVRLRVSTSS